MPRGLIHFRKKWGQTGKKKKISIAPALLPVDDLRWIIVLGGDGTLLGASRKLWEAWYPNTGRQSGRPGFSNLYPPGKALFLNRNGS